MGETTVVNIKRTGPGGWDVYIGRAMPRQGLRTSKWANHFKVGQDGTRDDVIRKYREHIMKTPVLLAQVGDLRGKRLACWCKPLPCHGDVLAQLADRAPGAAGEGETE